MVIIHALDLFLGTDSSKNIEGVVTDHQCLPTSHGEVALSLEGSVYSQVKDTNKSLQIMIYSVLHKKDVLGLLMMNRNTGNLKNTQLIHKHTVRQQSSS